RASISTRAQGCGVKRKASAQARFVSSLTLALARPFRVLNRHFRMLSLRHSVPRALSAFVNLPCSSRVDAIIIPAVGDYSRLEWPQLRRSVAPHPIVE